MSTLPTPSQERFFRRLLLPFKVYVIFASVWLIYSALKAHSEHVVPTGLSVYLLAAYGICIPYFLIAALIQFIYRWPRPAWISISFALFAFIILVISWWLIASGFEK
jgi:thiol:disulfide interchange protein